MDTSLKKCNRCNEVLPLTKEYFYSDKSKKDGFTTLCKKCKGKREVIYCETDIGKVITSEDTQKVGVYKITNKISELIYIGSSINLYRRKLEHLIELRKNNHSNEHLQKSFNKYGEENFEFTILEFILDVDKLIEREQYWIDYYQSNNKIYGYNIREFADSNLNLVCSQETRQRLSELNKNKIVSEETRKKISEANKGKSRKHTPEQIEKQKNAMKGRKFSDSHRENISKAKIKYFKENPLNDEQKKLRSDRIKGEKNPMFGKPRTNETIEKYSKKVLQYDLNHNFIREYISVSETKKYGFDPSTVCACCKGKLKQHKKYIWKYKDNDKKN